MSVEPRRWFQIHLSTAVVLMFVAGGVMIVNQKHITKSDGAPTTRDARVEFQNYGWPFEACVVSYMIGDVSIAPFNPAVGPRQPVPEYVGWHLKYLGLAMNIACGMTLLLITGMLCEILIRRREARTP